MKNEVVKMRSHPRSIPAPTWPPFGLAVLVVMSVVVSVATGASIQDTEDLLATTDESIAAPAPDQSSDASSIPDVSDE